MEKKIVIHKHFLGGGGIGDFIRASLSFYSICKKNCFEYYINFDENKILEKCFIYKEVPKIYLSNNYVKISLPQLGEIMNEDVFITKINEHNEKIIYLYSNAIGIEKSENINLIINEYFSNILRPSEKVQNYINLCYSKLKISDNNYLSVHIRCGDKYIDPDNNNYTSIDSRINMEDNDIYNKYNNSIQKFKNDYNIDIPIIIHSDSDLFKKNLLKINNEYKIIDIKVSHISEQIGLKDEDSFISTIAEFFILVNARIIFTPYTYSGFSHIASIIKKKKLYTYLHHSYYHLLNSNNIIFL